MTKSVEAVGSGVRKIRELAVFVERGMIKPRGSRPRRMAQQIVSLGGSGEGDWRNDAISEEQAEAMAKGQGR
jgi:hypothetical protein